VTVYPQEYAIHKPGIMNWSFLPHPHHHTLQCIRQKGPTREAELQIIPLVPDERLPRTEVSDCNNCTYPHLQSAFVSACELKGQSWESHSMQ